MKNEKYDIEVKRKFNPVTQINFKRSLTNIYNHNEI